MILEKGVMGVEGRPLGMGISVWKPGGCSSASDVAHKGRREKVVSCAKGSHRSEYTAMSA